jgi:hypothetical protein
MVKQPRNLSVFTEVFVKKKIDDSLFFTAEEYTKLREELERKLRVHRQAEGTQRCLKFSAIKDTLVRTQIYGHDRRDRRTSRADPSSSKKQRVRKVSKITQSSRNLD